MMMRQRFSAIASLFFLVPILAGCAGLGLPQDEVADFSQLDGGQVLIVGKVVITPPLREFEKDLTIPNDVFQMSKMVRNRALLSFAAHPKTKIVKAKYRINPVVGQTYFFGLRRDVPFMVGGSITTEYSVVGGNIRATEIIIPGSLRADLRPGDRAIYVGTLRLKRDEFNEVTEARVVDEYGQAAAAFRARFGSGIPLRKALFGPAG